MKHRIIFGLALAPVAETGSGNVGVSETLLYRGDARDQDDKPGRLMLTHVANQQQSVIRFYSNRLIDAPT
jgi:hypothetical protein